MVTRYDHCKVQLTLFKRHFYNIIEVSIWDKINYTSLMFSFSFVSLLPHVSLSYCDARVDTIKGSISRCSLILFLFVVSLYTNTRYKYMAIIVESILTATSLWVQKWVNLMKCFFSVTILWVHFWKIFFKSFQSLFIWFFFFFF